MAKQNNFLGILGFLGLWLGTYAIIVGTTSLTMASIFATLAGIPLIGGLFTQNIIGTYTNLGIISVIGGAILAVVGLKFAVENGGKIIKMLIGIISLLSALLCAFIGGILVFGGITIIGTVFFAMIMIILFLIADWGMGTSFFTKFVKALPIVGDFAVRLVKAVVPLKT